jgi:N-acetyl-anhydromuramyl-L-alanine amidase AmpD|tara:strand:- start:126 stop:710 length:585 start_codon:yes stop_codon:yes gene_type:complete
MKLLFNSLIKFISSIIFKKNSETKDLIIHDLINILPWHETRKWSRRQVNKINKIIIHQAASAGTIASINRYHITPGEQNHLSSKGAPHIAYHYTIDRIGNVNQCNTHNHITWHCKRQNTSSISILVSGDFDGGDYSGKDSNPSKEQLNNLNLLLDKLLDDLELTNQDIYGHSDFGKPACPGYAIINLINERKSK